MKHLKHVEIITQQSQATERDAMYIIPTDQDFCEVIFVDSMGNKRKLSGGGGSTNPNISFEVNENMELVQTGGEEYDFELINGELILNN